MAILLYEREDSRPISRTVNSAKEKLHFIAKGSTDQAAIYVAMLLYSPLIWDGLWRQGVDVTPLGAGVWDCWAEYAFSAESQGEIDPRDEPDDTTILGPEFDFDITAQTAHITQSLSTTRSIAAIPSGGTLIYLWTANTAYFSGQQVVNGSNQYTCTASGTSGSVGPTGTGTGISDGSVTWDYVSSDFAKDPRAPDYKGAIGVAGGQVAGTDIFTGHMEFGVTVQVYPVQLPYLRSLLETVGTTNRNTWYKFPAGTLLYLGATGSCKPGSIWTLHHKFAAAPNITNIPVGDSIIVPMKKGWEYLWCTYRDMQSAASGLMMQVPAAAYVEQVYRDADYATNLGLGA